MKPLRFGVWICLIFLFWHLSPCCQNVASAAGPDRNVSFQWAFGALVGDEANRQLVSITRDAKLNSGDQFKMMVALKEKCFVYVIYYGGQGEIQLLFPNDWKQFTENYQVSEKYYIPQGGLWFSLDEKTGAEKFYLLASAERLNQLETLFDKYESADATGKSNAADQIIDEIKKLRLERKTFQAAAERPINIGGNVRGTNTANNLDAIAVEMTATDFFSRTFTIDHK